MTRTLLILLCIFLGCGLGLSIGKIVSKPRSSPFSCSAIFPSSPLPSTLEHEPLPKYSWEKTGKLSPITKEYFRCKGSSINPPIPSLKDGKVIENFFDCSPHSLPIRHEKEFIYPILIELLNEIQTATGKAVVITSGHRCPLHNRYIDSSSKNQSSKHQLGAEVAFYVSGLEHQPQVILNAIFAFYKSNPKYASLGKAYLTFERYEKPTDVTTKPWFNKEIFIKWHSASEGRNGDNRHTFPYFSIQVRFDIDTNIPIAYSEKEAQLFFRK